MGVANERLSLRMTKATFWCSIDVSIAAQALCEPGGFAASEYRGLFVQAGGQQRLLFPRSPSFPAASSGEAHRLAEPSSVPKMH